MRDIAEDLLTAFARLIGRQVSYTGNERAPASTMLGVVTARAARLHAKNEAVQILIPNLEGLCSRPRIWTGNKFGADDCSHTCPCVMAESLLRRSVVPHL